MTDHVLGTRKRCFQATDTSGHLTPTVPCVLHPTAPDHPAIANLTTDSTTTTVDVSWGDFEFLEEGISGSAESVLGGVRVTG
ncbi:hypothetical protein [Streptomyces sp. NPDC006691]|uniref:hypothetical protein n=1 Tax=Streptomyces sp. NPDC006691 TaxID=3364757 RepID=UPI00367DC06E